MAPASAFAGTLPMRFAGVRGCGFTARVVRFPALGPDEELRREGRRGGRQQRQARGADRHRLARGAIAEAREGGVLPTLGGRETRRRRGGPGGRRAVPITTGQRDYHLELGCGSVRRG